MSSFSRGKQNSLAFITFRVDGTLRVDDTQFCVVELRRVRISTSPTRRGKNKKYCGYYRLMVDALEGRGDEGRGVTAISLGEVSSNL